MSASDDTKTLEKLSVLEKVRSLREQSDELQASVKIDALAVANKAVSVLNELGFRYRLVEGRKANFTRSRGKGVTIQMRDFPCPICHFKTVPPHDGRLHRSQNPKKPLTTAELKERHLSKVG